LDLGRLRTLREIAIRGSMAAAADALHLTPSAVSQQVAQLEDEFGLPLTERMGRGVRLSRAGEVLVSYTGRVLGVLDEAISELATMKEQVTGELRIAAFPSIAAAILPHTVQTLSRSYPHLTVVLEEMEPAEGLAALGSWQADVAIIDDLSLMLGGKRHGLERVPLAEDVLVALLPHDHPLADRPSLQIADLRNELWAAESTSSIYGEFVVALCRRAGFEPKLNAKCRSFEMVNAMVASGCAVSVVPGLRMTRDMLRVKAVKVRPEVRRKISIAYRKEARNHPAVRVLVEQLVLSAAENVPA